MYQLDSYSGVLKQMVFSDKVLFRTVVVFLMGFYINAVVK